jgi:AcrR family transcriptional regulator
VADAAEQPPRRRARVTPRAADGGGVGGRGRRAAETGDAVIVEAAIAAMFENGYHGTSVREIADRAGMSVANVYYYFASKHDLLFRFMDNSAAQLLVQLEDVLASAREEPAERLAAIVRMFVQRHTIRQAAAFVAATELRALDDDARATVVARRNAIEALFREVVADGVARGAFTTTDPTLAVRAILDMGSSVSSWYRQGGSMSGAEIADRYVELALSLVGAAPAGGPTRS